MRKLQQKRKILAIFGDKRARAKILSGVVFVLMLIAGMAGLFISEKATANPADYIYTEDFEDDTVGDATNNTNPDEPWYNYTEYAASNAEISTTYAHGGSNSFYLHGTAGILRTEWNFNSSSSFQLEWFQFWYYATSSHAVMTFTLTNNTGASNPAAVALKIGAATGDPSIMANDNGTWTDTGWDYTASTWQAINVTVSYTNHTFKVGFYNGTAWDYKWYDMNDDADGIVQWRFTRNTAGTDIYIDDVTVGSPIALQGTGVTIVISISPDSDGDGRISFGSTNQTNVSMDSIDFLNVTNNGTSTISTLVIHMQNVGGTIPTYYGGATNCRVYKWNGTGEPSGVDLSNSNWEQVATFDSNYNATISVSLAAGDSVYLAFRILDNDPEDNGIAVGTHESAANAHYITAT